MNEARDEGQTGVSLVGVWGDREGWSVGKVGGGGKFRTTRRGRETHPLEVAADVAREQGRTPLVSVGRLGRWEIASWRESWGAPYHDFSGMELAVLGEGVGEKEVARLVVADPAENVLAEDCERNSAKAVAAVWDCARWENTPEGALRAASRRVCDPERRPRQRNPLACACICDLDMGRPRVLAGARGGDCELWVRDGEGFEAVWESDIWWAETRRRYDEERRANPEVGVWVSQEAVADDPMRWRHHPIGMVVDPVLEVLDGMIYTKEVVVSSDGARLNKGNLIDLGEWLAKGIREVPADWPWDHPFGDLALTHARYVD